MSAFRVGLTGGLACGKSTLAAHLAAAGATVLDADEVVRELTAKGGAGLAQLVDALGDWVCTPDGEYDRAAVRARVFAEPALRRQVEEILHPLARAHMHAGLAAARSPYAVAVVPLLFESGHWEDSLQHIVTVECAPAVQLARAAQRDGTDDAARIIAAQLPASERRQRADEVVENDGTPEELAAVAAALHQRLLQMAATN